MRKLILVILVFFGVGRLQINAQYTLYFQTDAINRTSSHGGTDPIYTSQPQYKVINSIYIPSVITSLPNTVAGSIHQFSPSNVSVTYNTTSTSYINPVYTVTSQLYYYYYANGGTNECSGTNCSFYQMSPWAVGSNTITNPDPGVLISYNLTGYGSFKMKYTPIKANPPTVSGIKKPAYCPGDVIVLTTTGFYNGLKKRFVFQSYYGNTLMEQFFWNQTTGVPTLYTGLIYLSSLFTITIDKSC